jgi:hypothetical protein
LQSKVDGSQHKRACVVGFPTTLSARRRPVEMRLIFEVKRKPGLGVETQSWPVAEGIIPMNQQHRNTPSIRRRESKTAIFECQSLREPGQVGGLPPKTRKGNSGSEPSTAHGNANRVNEEGGKPTIVGRTRYDFISENCGGLSSALAEFVRSMNPIVLLMTVAYVLLCIFAKPSGSPMSFGAFCIILAGYDLLLRPLGTFLRRLLKCS